MTPDQAKQAIMGLRAMYGTQDVPTEMLMAYGKQLEKYEIEPVRQAFQKLIDTDDTPFFPPWATIKRYIEQETAAFTVDADSAWEIALDYSGSVGAYRTPQWQDPIIAQTIRRMGGWREFCTTEQDRHWLRKEFIATYNEIAERAMASGRLPELVRTPGVHEVSQGRQDDDGLRQIEPKMVEEGNDDEG